MANKNNGIMKPLPKQIEDFQNLEKTNQYLFMEVKKLKGEINALKIRNSDLFQNSQRLATEIDKQKDEKDSLSKTSRFGNEKLNKMIALLQQQLREEKMKNTSASNLIGRANQTFDNFSCAVKTEPSGQLPTTSLMKQGKDRNDRKEYGFNGSPLSRPKGFYSVSPKNRTNGGK